MKNALGAALAAVVMAGCAKSGRASDMPSLVPGGICHGFKVQTMTELPEVGGWLWQLEYAKNGALVAWLERADENKTFGIAFRTLPADDTGVAHILEHSVLCGSAKYPVKEPFVDLLKSSLATFLNAYTSKDQTVYPVSSRDHRDFLNLVDVYLDAVFHPLSAENPVMFRQEGWHYEFSPKGELVRNGVVYNEMKGVYASPGSVAFREICKLLYPDTCYRYDSGGDPRHIGELSFEGYRDFYRKYYHPSNARIFLDGALDIDDTLAKLNEYLGAFERRTIDAEIPRQAPVARAATVPYSIGATESAKDKTILAEGWTFAEYDDSEREVAFEVLAETLAGSNEAPLKKALLAEKLCEDVMLDAFSFRQCAAFLYAKNVPDGKADEFRRILKATLADLAKNGLDHARLAAVLDRKEFQTRELFSGGGTCGIKFMNLALDRWLYGGDMAQAFRLNGVFAKLREGIAKGYFEKFLRSALVDNPHHAELTMSPSKTLAAERLQAEAAELAQTLASWDAATLARVKAETAEVDAFRAKVDTPAELAALPALSPADLPRRGRERRLQTTEVEQVKVLSPAAGARGVFYLTLAFALDDLTDDELVAAPFLATVLGELATRRYDALALKNALDAILGHFSTGVGVYAARPGDTLNANGVMKVEVAALAAKMAEVAQLVPEVLLATRFDNAQAIADLLRQSRLGMEHQASTIEGRLLARRRAAAAFSAKGAMEDSLSGIGQLRHLQAAEKRFADSPDAFMRGLARLADKIFTRGRLTVVASDNLPAAELQGLLKAFPAGRTGARAKRRLPPRRREGFTIAAETAYAAQGSHLGRPVTGAELVAARLLSLTFLWDEIRVKGGAYGGGLRLTDDGHAGFLSWRDPNPSRSLGVYARAAAHLRDFAAGNEPLDRYVVGTLGATDPCLTARGETALAADLYLSGRDFESLQRRRAEILGTTRADLLAAAKVLERLNERTSVCVLGGASALAGCSNAVDTVEAVAR